MTSLLVVGVVVALITVVACVTLGSRVATPSIPASAQQPVLHLAGDAAVSVLSRSSDTRVHLLWAACVRDFAVLAERYDSVTPAGDAERAAMCDDLLQLRAAISAATTTSRASTAPPRSGASTPHHDVA